MKLNHMLYMKCFFQYVSIRFFFLDIKMEPYSETLNCKEIVKEVLPQQSTLSHYIYCDLACDPKHTNGSRNVQSPKEVCIISSVEWSGTNRMNVFTMNTEVNTIIR